MQKAGYSPFYAYKIFANRWNDFFHRKGFTLKQKWWAQKRGFYSRRITMFGLTEENYQDFLPDFDYYRLHPVNGIFSRWIDDKLTIRYILDPYSEYLPKYYYHLNRGEILRLPDCPKNIGQNIDDVISLLKNVKALAVKLLASSSGEGFIKLSVENENFLVNNNKVPLETLRTSIKGWMKVETGGYLITEYLYPCQELSQMWESTPNAIRLSVIRKKHEAPVINGAYIRFGTKKTGVIDNANAGGVTCEIDLNDGRFFNGIMFKDKIIYECRYHPDTKELVEGTVPRWTQLKEKIIEISQYIPEIIYMGYDVVVTDDGFKIIEINSHQGISNLQLYSPYLKNEITSRFFKELLEQKKQEISLRKNQTLLGKIRLLLQKLKSV
jgi:hypothetical protein